MVVIPFNTSFKVITCATESVFEPFIAVNSLLPYTYCAFTVGFNVLFVKGVPMVPVFATHINPVVPFGNVSTV